MLTVEGQAHPLNIPRADLPAETAKGDHVEIEIEEGKVTMARLNLEARAQTEARIRKKVERLRRGEHLEDNNRMEDQD